MPRPAMAVMVRPACAVIAFALPLRPMSIGLFFGFFFGSFCFDFFAEFLFFGVPASAFFAFVVGFFDRDRFVFALVGFAVVRFGFVVCAGGRGRRPDRKWQAEGVG
jgi:hypothetical protein